MSVAPRIDPVRTTCPYCGVGCGVCRRRRTARSSGDPAHPANRGRLCSKGAALGETLETRRPAALPADRRPPGGLGPGARSGRRRLRRTIARHGPDAVALYVSGQFLTEDYYVANKLMKGFIGSGQHRHQLAAVHGVVGRGPHARLRRGHRARLLRGPRRGRPRRAGRQQRRVVPSGAVPAPRRPPRRRAAPRSSSSIRAAPRPATSPTCTSPIRPAPMSPCSPGCCVHLRRARRLSTASLSARARAGSQRRFEAARALGAVARRSRRASPTCDRGRLRSVLRLVRRHRAHRHAAIRRG